MERKIRWGILGAAGIARKNWSAIHASGNGVVAAVASRDAARAASFVRACQEECPFDETPRAVGGYDELLAGDDLDVIYVPLPTGLRREWVVRAAEKGKHVLCEKPCAPNVADLRAMTEACAANGVQFMEGVMFMHSKRLEALARTVRDQERLGAVRRITSAFSFAGNAEFLEGNIRLHSELEPAGCLGDLGWYTIRIALVVMGYEMPETVRATMWKGAGRDDSPEQVPIELSAELRFAGGVSASFYNSFRTGHEQWLRVACAGGSVQIDDFVLPRYQDGSEGGTREALVTTELGLPEMGKERIVTPVAETAGGSPTTQQAALFRNFGELVRSGKPDPFWPAVAMQTQRVIDACLQSAREGGAVVVP